MFVGDRVFDARWRSYGFIEHSGGELVVKSEEAAPTSFKPDELGWYVISANRTERGLAK